MEQSIRALNRGSQNGNDGISLVQTAQGAMTQIMSDLQRMRELASQGASGTNGSTDLAKP